MEGVDSMSLQEKIDELENKLVYCMDGYYGSMIEEIMDDIQALMEEAKNGTGNSKV